MAFNPSTLFATACTGTTLYCIDSTDNQNPEFNVKKFSSIAGASVITTGVTLVNATTCFQDIKEIYNNDANAYIESMSDEELADALQKMELLASDNIEENNTKKI